MTTDLIFGRKRGRWARPKIRFFASLAVSSLVLAACSPANASAQSKPAHQSKKITIAFVVGAEADPYFITMNLGAQAEASKLGVQLIWQGNPSQYSAATETPILQQVITELRSQKPSALVFSPVAPLPMDPYVAAAVKAGIPTFNVDSLDANQKNITGTITGNNTQGGEAAATALAKAMRYTSGHTYNVVVGMSNSTTTPDVLRLAGFKKQIAAHYPGIVIKGVSYSQSSPTTANANIQNWLTEYGQSSKTPLNGIFAIDGTNGEGASSALIAAGLACSKTACGAGHIALVGYDGYSTSVPDLTAGVFSALIAQQPYQEGAQSVLNAYTYLKTGKLPKGVAKTTTIPNETLLPTSSSATLTKYVYATA
jgi:ABC-type sugar transport system substrate-binding protein